jgi:ribose 5-phosphate isomerase RpiB
LGALTAVALCGSGIGASVAANNNRGVRAGLIGAGLALELIQTFLHPHFSGAARHQRRLAKVQALEIGIIQP